MSEAALFPPVSSAVALHEGASAPIGSLDHAEALLRPLFDPVLYAAEYQDVLGDADAALRHFCLRGWREGRNPNRDFDTATYLLAHPDVAAAGINPYYHYVLVGRNEGRTVASAAIPSEIARQAFGRAVGDWVTLLRPQVDIGFYVAALGPVWTASFDPVAHYCYFGWLERRDPNPRTSIAQTLAAEPWLLEMRLNPSLAAVVAAQTAPIVLGPDDRLRTTRRARHARPPQRPARTAAPAAGLTHYNDPVADCVAQHLDRAYYLAAYPDVHQHGIDPVVHYCGAGWREGRNPAAWFDTQYYLATNQDVAQSGINPFWHYVVAGKTEGRKPVQPGGYRKRVLDDAAPPGEVFVRPTGPAPTGVLSRAEIDSLLRAAVEASTGLAISVSHDRYLNIAGGIQLFLAEEQSRFRAVGIAYLHLSPFVTQLRLADAMQAGQMLNLVLDGGLVGVATSGDVAASLQNLPMPHDYRRLFLVHCLLGHDPRQVAALHRAFGATDNYFWLHDYSSLCAGYNLLRNDVVFCGAPPPGSMACRVCVYGDGRAKHLTMVRALFEAVPFHIVAPSAAALDVWRQGSDLPYLSVAVHEHCCLDPAPSVAPATPRSGAVRVAFVGHTRANKGWPIWLELLAQCGTLPEYRFFHLGTADTKHAIPGLEHHIAAATPEQPGAMVEAIAALAIDLVVVPAPWPETFCFVALEALAAGADIVCLADSGNVADTVLRCGRGVVASDASDLLRFFSSLGAADYTAHLREAGVATGRLVRQGTTATLATSP